MSWYVSCVMQKRENPSTADNQQGRTMEDPYAFPVYHPSVELTAATCDNAHEVRKLLEMMSME
jgi:hypothetical protein